MPTRRADLIALALLTVLVTIITLAVAGPLMFAPGERIFGLEIVGRHHDPFTVMQQFDRPLRLTAYTQLMTDAPGRALSLLWGPIAAYNALVLASFPLSAAAAFLLARHLSLSYAGAILAGLAFAFSPFHVAQAAYHPHIAQVQWIAFYFLALWRCLDAATPAAVAWLGAATLAVTLSNFYGGFIAAALTPAAVIGYWLTPAPGLPRRRHSLAVTTLSLATLAVAGLAYSWLAAGIWLPDASGFAVSRTDLSVYSATWWSYVMVPVAHPWFGDTARRIWAAAGVGDGLLEQQVALGFGLIALALVALAAWRARDRNLTAARYVPALVAVGVMAWACSLSPLGPEGSRLFSRPSTLLHEWAPMFRSYARFGVVVQLMTAMLAGIGVDWLRRSGTWRTQAAMASLALLIVFEYAVTPSAMSRDVLPTKGHRWLLAQGPHARALDCARPGPDADSVAWLTGGRVTMRGSTIDDCREPALADKLAAHGYTHLLLRRDTVSPPLASPQLALVAALADSWVFAVTARRPEVYTATMAGFSMREADATWSWRWMGDDASWSVTNTTTQPVRAAVTLEMASFNTERRLTLRLDAEPVETIVVAPSRRLFHVGPLNLPPGHHVLSFHPLEPATVADQVTHNGDRRPLSIAIGAWTWLLEGIDP